MANEQFDDKYEGQEESEYHFSDDHVNYDLEPELAKSEAPVGSSPKANPFAKLKQSPRRMMIGVVVFVVLLSLTYKILVPAPATTPTTEFSPQPAQTGQTKPAPDKSKPVVAQSNSVVPAVPQNEPTAQAAPVAPPVETVQTTAPVNAPVTAPVMMPQNPAVTVQAVPPAAPTTMPVPSQATMTQAPTAPPPGVSAMPANPQDRLSSLEQQNAAIMNLLQTQYAQKLADYEAQNTQMRTQIQEMNSRISGMEVAFRQLTKILRTMRTGDGAVESNNTAAMPVPRSSQPKSAYTVQAIIPGRAWLKADSGDTITVAEGDVLRDYGRITKIDPYDGIVNIDTGNKVITLSYGSSND